MERAAAQARRGVLGRRLVAPADRARRRPISQRAAEVLNAGKKVAMLVGAGCKGADRRGHRDRRQAGRGLRQGAARQGRAARRPAVGDRLDRPARHQAELGPDDGMRHLADARLGLSLFGIPAQGRPGARRAGRYRPGHAVDPLSRTKSICEGDVGATIDALLPLLEQKTDTGWRDDIAGWKEDWEETLRDRAMVAANPVNPQRIFTELSPRLPDRAIVTSDSGSAPTGMRATSRSGAA